MIDLNRIHRIGLKLVAIRSACPESTFGIVIERIEDMAWDSVPHRYCSARLMNMPDELFEHGLDLWMKANGVTVSGGWKS